MRTFSQLVSIPQWCDCCGREFIIFEQFNCVSIPQWCDCCGEALRASMRFVASFNPTMVRLLRLWWCLTPLLTLTFQSHNGAIAASSSPLQKQVTKTFQSHNGAIAAINPTLADNIATGFNPTMVRLLHFLLSSSSVNLLVSIPQWCDCCK